MEFKKILKNTDKIDRSFEKTKKVEKKISFVLGNNLNKSEPTLNIKQQQKEIEKQEQKQQKQQVRQKFIEKQQKILEKQQLMAQQKPTKKQLFTKEKIEKTKIQQNNSSTIQTNIYNPQKNSTQQTSITKIENLKNKEKPIKTRKKKVLNSATPTSITTAEIDGTETVPTSKKMKKSKSEKTTKFEDKSSEKNVKKQKKTKTVITTTTPKTSKETTTPTSKTSTTKTQSTSKMFGLKANNRNFSRSFEKILSDNNNTNNTDYYEKHNKNNIYGSKTDKEYFLNKTTSNIFTLKNFDDLPEFSIKNKNTKNKKNNSTGILENDRGSLLIASKDNTLANEPKQEFYLNKKFNKEPKKYILKQDKSENIPLEKIIDEKMVNNNNNDMEKEEVTSGNQSIFSTKPPAYPTKQKVTKTTKQEGLETKKNFLTLKDQAGLEYAAQGRVQADIKNGVQQNTNINGDKNIKKAKLTETSLDTGEDIKDDMNMKTLKNTKRDSWKDIKRDVRRDKSMDSIKSHLSFMETTFDDLEVYTAAYKEDEEEDDDDGGDDDHHSFHSKKRSFSGVEIMNGITESKEDDEDNDDDIDDDDDMVKIIRNKNSSAKSLLTKKLQKEKEKREDENSIKSFQEKGFILNWYNNGKNNKNTGKRNKEDVDNNFLQIHEEKKKISKKKKQY